MTSFSGDFIGLDEDMLLCHIERGLMLYLKDTAVLDHLQRCIYFNKKSRDIYQQEQYHVLDLGCH